MVQDFGVSYANIQDVLGGSTSSLRTWTKNLPSRAVDGATKYFRADEVIFALRKHRRGGLSGSDAARLLDGLPEVALAVQDSTQRADALRHVLSTPEIERLERCEKSALEGAAYHWFDQFSEVDTATLRNLVALNIDVLRYVLNRDRSRLPVTRAAWGDLVAVMLEANGSAPA